MTFIDPGVTPVTATAPLHLSILSMQAPATAAGTTAAIAEDQSPRVPEQDPEPVPEIKPDPVVKRVRPTHRPEPSPRASAPPVKPQTPAPAPENQAVAVSTLPAAPPAAGPATAVTTVSRKVEYLYNPPPDYPPRARRMGQEGEVLIRARVLPGGESGELQIEQSSGYALLDQAAMEAVRKWRFRPARRGDEQIVSWVEIPVRFRLEH